MTGTIRTGSRPLLVIAAVLSTAACATMSTGSSTAGTNRVEVVSREGERRVDVLVEGQPFTAYVYPTTLKKPTLFPVRTASGKLVTRGYPIEPRAGERVDHPHHVGLWFNFGDVNGLDFWNNSTAISAARAPRMGTIVHRSVRKAQSGIGRAELEVTSDWVNHQGKALLREDTRFAFHAGSGGHRAIDRITTLTALDTTVTFRDNKEGVIGIRVARQLEHPTKSPEVFTDASGKPTNVPVLNNDGVTGFYRTSEGKEGDDVWSTRGRWTTLTGTVGGGPVTLAILDHPSNFGYPTYWHARGYGLFAANPLGRKVFDATQPEVILTLAPGQSTTFRHRILVLDAKATPEQIEQQYSEFSR